MSEPVPSCFRLGQHIRCVPTIHGRGIFAQETRRLFLADSYDCVAVELPPSVGPTVVEATGYLPCVTAVVYQEDGGDHCYVPVEPGEAIIEAIRLAHEERRRIEFVDMETASFPVDRPTLPDEYAISQVGLEKYYQTVLPLLPPSQPGSVQERREQWMARQLKSLDKQYQNILFVCGMAHLEGIRRHFAKPPRVKPDKVQCVPHIYAVNPDSLYLLMGEIPYIIYLYEKSRYALEIDLFDKTDGIKELLLETRKEFCQEFPDEMERMSPAAMQVALNYLRNLCLMQGRLTPAMYDLVVAAQGVCGGGFGAKLVEMAKFYPYQKAEIDLPNLNMGVDSAHIEPLGEVPVKNRLPGPPFSLRNIRLERLPKKEKKQKWQRRWGAHTECSWPEEDERIENFTTHVRQRAMGMVGEDQSKVEKFVSSIKDGLDMRETLRQWHTGEIYVKEMPPARGEVGAVVFIFDGDTGKYPWRSTWLAEHQNESTLCFYATDYAEDMVGPGIGRAFYGGALFIFPPIIIPNIWVDPQFKNDRNEMHILTTAAMVYSHTPFVAYVAHQRPDAEMRAMARRLKRHLIYLPISNFSAYTLRKLRKFHVLQGHHIRSYARQYIR